MDAPPLTILEMLEYSRVGLESAGALLAQSHDLSLLISPPEQRPEALPMDACRPRSAKTIAERFQRDLADARYNAGRRCVLHGDCTLSNMLVDEQRERVSALIDFTLAHLGPPEADISFALWVTGRTERLAVRLDATRMRAFVAGYHRVRPLGARAAEAIPLYLCTWSAADCSSSCGSSAQGLGVSSASCS